MKVYCEIKIFFFYKIISSIPSFFSQILQNTSSICWLNCIRNKYTNIKLYKRKEKQDILLKHLYWGNRNKYWISFMMCYNSKRFMVHFRISSKVPVLRIFLYTVKKLYIPFFHVWSHLWAMTMCRPPIWKIIHTCQYAWTHLLRHVINFRTVYAFLFDQLKRKKDIMLYTVGFV